MTEHAITRVMLTCMNMHVPYVNRITTMVCPHVKVDRAVQEWIFRIMQNFVMGKAIYTAPATNVLESVEPMRVKGPEGASNYSYAYTVVFTQCYLQGSSPKMSKYGNASGCLHSTLTLSCTLH